MSVGLNDLRKYRFRLKGDNIKLGDNEFIIPHTLSGSEISQQTSTYYHKKSQQFGDLMLPLMLIGTRCKTNSWVAGDVCNEMSSHDMKPTRKTYSNNHKWIKSHQEHKNREEPRGQWLDYNPSDDLNSMTPRIFE